MLQLNARVGDTLALGNARFTIAGTIDKMPSDFTFRSALGPRVVIGGQYLAETGLVRFGSLSQRQAFLTFSDEKALDRFVNARRTIFRANLIDYDTAREQSQNLAQALSALTRFLGLVGLAALLLGGVGVASAVHVFIREKRAIIATLRCLGATQAQVFSAYLVQASGLGLLGAFLGVLLGLIVEGLLPTLLKGVLPVAVHFRVDWVAIGAGLIVGVWVATLFALIPLLAIRGIAPLQALRREYEPARRRFDSARAAAIVALIGSIVAISLWQADRWRVGMAFSGGLAGTLLLLWLSAWSVTRLTR
jgi:putative ABC transport system permease protein